MSNVPCPQCHKNPATFKAPIGILPCVSCKLRHATLKKPGSYIPEFTTDDIKHQRVEFMDDIEQPHYKGALNKRWVDRWGKEAAKRQGYSDKEIANAQYVMDGLDRYYNDRT